MTRNEMNLDYGRLRYDKAQVNKTSPAQRKANTRQEDNKRKTKQKEETTSTKDALVNTLGEQ